jgi:hypothetical protein
LGVRSSVDTEAKSDIESDVEKSGSRQEGKVYGSHGFVSCGIDGSASVSEMMPGVKNSISFFRGREIHRVALYQHLHHRFGRIKQIDHFKLHLCKLM